MNMQKEGGKSHQVSSIGEQEQRANLEKLCKRNRREKEEHSFRSVPWGSSSLPWQTDAEDNQDKSIISRGSGKGTTH